MKKTILFYFLNSDLMGKQILKKKIIYDHLDKVLIASDSPLFLNRYQEKIKKARFFKIDQNLKMRLIDVHVFFLCSNISKKERKDLYATCAALDIYIVDLFCLEDRKNALTGLHLIQVSIKSLLASLEGLWRVESRVSFLDWFHREDTRLLLGRKVYPKVNSSGLKQCLRELADIKTKALFLSKEKKLLFYLEDVKAYLYKILYHLGFLRFFLLFKKKKLTCAYVFRMKDESGKKEITLSYAQFLKTFVNLTLEEVFHSLPQEYEKKLAEKIDATMREKLIEQSRVNSNKVE